MSLDARYYEGQPLQELVDRLSQVNVEPAALVRSRGHVEDQSTLNFSPNAREIEACQLPQEHPPVAIPQIMLKQLIGQGRQGLVYAGEVLSTHRMVAVKIVSQANASFVPALREALTCARLKHANIVRVLHVEQIGSFSVIVMELIVGQQLSTDLGSYQYKRILGQLSGALLYMASSGVVHRDVKPSNVLLRSYDRSPVLIDFGLAVDLAAAEWIPHQTQGTPIFMPPDALRGKAPEPFWDWYSLSITAIETLQDMNFTRKYRGWDRNSIVEVKLGGEFDAEARESLQRFQDSEVADWCRALLDTDPKCREDAMQIALRWASMRSGEK